LFHLRTHVDPASRADQELGALGRESVSNGRPAIQDGEVHFTLWIRRGKRAVFAAKIALAGADWKLRSNQSRA